jgi:hypothetical protein
MAPGDLVSDAGQWHVEWAGMLLGWPASAWTLSDLSGWLSLPDGEAANVNRQGRWGAFAGLQTIGPRTIEATFTYTGYGDAASLTELRAALAPIEDPQEQPLVVWAGTVDPELVWARVDKASIPSDYDFSMGLHRVTVSWVATSPLRYGLVEESVDIQLPYTDTQGGLHFNPKIHTGDALHFPLNFGGARGGGIGVVNNSGHLAVWPRFTLLGPADAPAIELIGGDGGRLATAAAYKLAAGQTLVLDTDARYPSQGPSGTPPGSINWVGRDDQLITRDWFPLPPGQSKISYTATNTSPDAVLTVSWRTAAVF